MVTKKVLTCTLLAIALLAITSTTLFAAGPESHGSTMLFRGNPPWVMGSSNSRIVPAQINRGKKLKTIYSNLGSSTDAYYSGTAWLILGSASAYGESEEVGMPFTPKGNASLTEIQVAFQYYSSGNNAGVVALYSDSAGLPGTAIKSWDVSNLVTFPSCCTLVKVKAKKPIKLKKGTQYWVVETTDSKSSNSEDAWNYTYNEATGNFAYNLAGAGWTSYNSYLGAYGVFGK
jgi:hypothetical protein